MSGKYEVYIEYPVDRVLSLVGTFDDLDAGVEYMNLENAKIDAEWRGDAKYFFLRDTDLRLETKNGADWLPLKE